MDTAILTVTGDTLTTYTENWTNVHTAGIDSTTALPVHCGANTLNMDKVALTELRNPPALPASAAA